VTTEPTPLIRASRYTAVGFNFVGTIGGGVACGWLIDTWSGSAPWALVTCTLLGVVGGFIAMIQTLRQLDRIGHEREP
jgi:F0F1-type ATP synthase assembly protein I